MGEQEGVGGDAQRGEVMKAAPAAALEVAEAELLFELLVVALDAPAQLGHAHQLLQRGGGGQGTQEVSGRFGFATRPLDQQPLLGMGFGVPRCGRLVADGTQDRLRQPGDLAPLQRLPADAGGHLYARPAATTLPVPAPAFKNARSRAGVSVLKLAYFTRCNRIDLRQSSESRISKRARSNELP